MNCIFLTTTSDLSKCTQLRRSLILNGWDFHFIEHEWKGFGSKIIETYHYLKAHPDITHFFYTDAWDTVALGTMEEAISNLPEDKEIILFGAERACYPHPDKADRYPAHDSPWKYLNGGNWFASAAKFIEMVDSDYPNNLDINDQAYFTDRLLAGWITLDYECKIFQTIAFCPESDFWFSTGVESLTFKPNEISCRTITRIGNNVTNTFPIFFHGNGHTPMPHIYALLPDTMNTLTEAASQWADNREAHRRINETFIDNVNATPELKAYRDWIESKIFGFGERSFLWMWKLIVDTLPPDFSFLEIGVFRGQILGLIRMLAPEASIVGITPLTSEGGHWESDYAADITLLHDTFKLEQPKIIKGLSTAPEVISEASKHQYDIIYVDGGHSYEVAKSDVFMYSSFVKVGGYLVIDDCAHKYDLPEGYFRGIETVSKAVDELLPNDYYVEVMNVMHNRIFKRIA